MASEETFCNRERTSARTGIVSIESGFKASGRGMVLGFGVAMLWGKAVMRVGIASACVRRLIWSIWSDWVNSVDKALR